jgi:hypothetical protein
MKRLEVKGSDWVKRQFSEGIYARNYDVNKNMGKIRVPRVSIFLISMMFFSYYEAIVVVKEVIAKAAERMK